jgi:two-component system, NarL family, response regulator NreC
MTPITERPITVALVDDHQMFRYAIRQYLDALGNVRLVSEASDARAAFIDIEQKRPDVVLLDVGLPGMDGLTATRDLVVRCPWTRVVILSGHDDAHLIDEAFASGAWAYIVKAETVDVVGECIRQVAAGQRYYPRNYIPSVRRRTTEPLGSLSPREREVFRLLVRGLSNRQIANAFSLSTKTIETHRGHILKKLDLHSAVELVRFAARHRLLDDVGSESTAS